MIFRHVIGKSVLIHEVEAGVEKLSVEKMGEGRREEMQVYLQDHRSALMRPRTCRWCMERYVPGELGEESFALGWVFGNRFDDICMSCYSKLLLETIGKIEKDRAGNN